MHPTNDPAAAATTAAEAGAMHSDPETAPMTTEDRAAEACETATPPDPALEIGRLEGALEAAQRSGRRLRAALDAILPLVRAYQNVAPEAGGPDPSSFVRDPEDESVSLLPELLEGELALHETAMAFLLENEEATPAEFGPEDNLVDEELSPAPHRTAGDPLVALLREALSAIEAERAHRIAGLPSDQAAARKATALRDLAEALGAAA